MTPGATTPGGPATIGEGCRPDLDEGVSVRRAVRLHGRSGIATG